MEGAPTFPLMVLVMLALVNSSAETHDEAWRWPGLPALQRTTRPVMAHGPAKWRMYTRPAGRALEAAQQALTGGIVRVEVD